MRQSRKKSTRKPIFSRAKSAGNASTWISRLKAQISKFWAAVPAGTDNTLLFLALVTTVLGLVFIVDAGYVQSIAVNETIVPPAFVSQVKALLISAVAYAVVRRIRPDWIQKNAKGIILVIIGLLIAVELVGTSQNGAKRWLGPTSMALQPAEFAKLGIIIYLASVLCTKKAWDETWAERRKKPGFFWQVVEPKFIRFWPAIVVLFVWFLIEREKDLGTASVVLVTAIAMFCTVPKTWKSVVAVALILSVGVSAFIAKEPYRMQRITVHTARWEKENINKDSYQTIHSELAMVSGGVIGTGFGSGRAKHMIPATTTDFIMATIAEECGFWGPMICLMLVGGIAFRLLMHAQNQTDMFRKLVLSGAAWWIAIQATTNLMMANATLPAIGIPFPFISAGGSSLMALWITLGVCERMSISPELEKAEAKNATRHHWWRHRRARLPRA